MQQPGTMAHVTSQMYYLPTKPAVVSQYLKGGPGIHRLRAGNPERPATHHRIRR